MKIINDTVFKAAGFLGRVPPHALSATVFVKGTFKMRPGADSVPAEAGDQVDLTGDVHVDDDPERRLLAASDFALHKPRSDILLKGTCHAPGGKPTEVCRVALRVGAWSKALGVIGDRHWKKSLFGSSMSEPEPFLSMPLTWERSFGGPGFARNPDGRGMVEVEGADGVPRHLLPNLEDPVNLIKGASARPEPAGFGPLSMGWPQRKSKAGSFNAKWLREHWPWFPEDTDWTLFNAAPEDQQLPAYLRGDETVVAENLHPAQPRYETRLPRLRLRWFVDEDVGDKLHFHEIPLRLDTLWVDMDAETLVLTWRGVAPVRKKMKEFVEHYIVAEPLDTAPLGAAEYYARLEARKREIEEAKARRPVPFVPFELPELAPPPLDWVKNAESEKAALEAEMKDVLARQEARRKVLAARLSELGLPMPAPATGKEDPFEAAHAAYERLKARDPAAAALFPEPKKADFHFDPIPPPPPAPKAEPGPRPKWTRDAVVDHAARKASFAGQDLSGLDLSGIDFSGLDLQGAVLAGAILAGCGFANADLSRASLAKADLGKANLVSAILDGADLAGSTLTGARFRGASLAKADLTAATMTGADLTDSKAPQALLIGADLSDATLVGAVLRGAQLDGASLSKADLTRADLQGASLEKTKGEGVILNQANLTKARISGAKLPGLSARRCAARESIWESAVLTKADVAFCDLTRASFESAVLEGAVLIACNLRNARLPEADLRGADLTGANLFRGTLESANLRGARLAGANLFEAELYQALAADCDFSSANLKGTKLA